MKKFMSALLAFALMLSCFMFTGCSNREEQLKMYVPGEYIDDEILRDFETWYTEQTGKKVEVVTPSTFDTVEEILTAVDRDHADYDLLLPSDYAVEQLIKKNLLLEVDRERVKVEDVIHPEYVKLAKVSDTNLKYSVPYMYGTFGIVYDYSKTEKHVDSWAAIYDNNDGKIKPANKDSLREAISSAMIWNEREALSALSNGFDFANMTAEQLDAYKAKIQAIYEDFSAETIEKACDTLSSTGYYGGEDLKFNMATGASEYNVALMWSCDAGYIMNDYEDEDGEPKTGNRDLWYVVPKEGGNIYLDTFVISKYAKNVDAAQYFLEFICQKEIALRSSEYAGAISPVKAAYDELYTEYDNDENYSEAELTSGWKDMYMEMLFPSDVTIKRCGTMRDYGDRDGDISVKWNNVRHH